MKRFTLIGMLILAALATAYYFLRPAPIDISLTGMYFPIINCEIEKVRAGIKAGFDVNARDVIGHTSLYFAIMNSECTVSQRQDMEKLLLEAGANPNVTNSLGDTLLNEMIYVATNDVDIVLVEELLRAGAKTELKNNDSDTTPLMVAAKNYYTDVFAKTLIKYGANVNTCTTEGFTPLMYALVNSKASPNLVMALIAAGANVNASSTNGLTPLLSAVRNPKASPDLVKALITAGADVNAVDRNSMTILDHALGEVYVYKTNENKKVILSLLRQAGAKKRSWGGEEPDIKPAE